MVLASNDLCDDLCDDVCDDVSDDVCDDIVMSVSSTMSTSVVVFTGDSDLLLSSRSCALHTHTPHMSVCLSVSK